MQETNSIYLKNPLGLKLMDYVHPNEVVQDDRMSLMEKRQLLCAWASDACAVESRPGFRWLPGTPGPIFVDHVLTALRTLDDLESSSENIDYNAKADHPGFLRTARSAEAASTLAGKPPNIPIEFMAMSKSLIKIRKVDRLC